MPGFVSYIDHTHIPGTNSLLGNAETIGPATVVEETFCSGKVYYAGQAIGLVVAETVDQARAAAAAVTVTYTNEQPPRLDMRELLDATGKRMDKSKAGKKGRQGPYNVTGELEIGSQYHFHMETQSCVVSPDEDGQYLVQSASQWQTIVQESVSHTLGVDLNKIDTKVKTSF